MSIRGAWATAYRAKATAPAEQELHHFAVEHHYLDRSSRSRAAEPARS